MTDKNYIKNLKQKVIIILTVICFICFSAFTLLACNNNSNGDTFTEETYTIQNKDDDLLLNSSFSYGLDKIEIKDDTFPISSLKEWKKSVDTYASTSSVESGIVSVNENNWKKLIANLYDDKDFQTYFKRENSDLETANVKEAIKTAEGLENTDSITDEQVKEYTVNKLLESMFANPKNHKDSNDSYVYMLNNYMSNDIGTAQKITTSTTMTIEKDSIYELSVWVKVLNIKGNDNINKDFGANIVVSNSINSVSQASFELTNIKSNKTDAENNDWTKYTIYIKSDKNYSGSFTLSLGLGFGNNSENNGKYFTEGTALFDDLSLKKVESSSIPSSFLGSTVVFGSKNKINYSIDGNSSVTGTNITNFVYDMNLASSLGSYVDVTDVTCDFTKSNMKTIGGENITSKYYDSTGTIVADGTKFTFTNSAGTIVIKDSDFKLNNDDNLKYAAISFDIKTNLNKLYSNNISVDVIDILGTTQVKRANVATIEPSEEFTNVILYIKNNFKNTERKFEINIVVGPEDVSSIERHDLVNGTVELRNVKLYSNYFEEEKYVSAEYPVGSDNPQFKVLKIFENNAKATVALYAGFEEDFNESSSSASSFSFNSTPNDMGAITNNPTTVKDYSGIVANHVFVKPLEDSSTVTNVINDRINSGDANGNNAGLINTKYVDSYTNSTIIKNALSGCYDSNNHIQPIMIYNNVLTSYGYIGQSNNISASSYAKISVKLRVVDNAIAYVYLVNTSSVSKDVMSFNEFTVNTDIASTAIGTEIDKQQYVFRVTKDQMVGNWCTVEFYIATGNLSKEFRVEVWNGARDESEKSQGFVFIDEITTTLTDAFKVQTRWADAFSNEESPLFNADRTNMVLYAHERQLSDIEIRFNKDYPEVAVSYTPNYVWAKNETICYSNFSTLEYSEYNPYDNVEKPEDTGCKANTDPSSFWLSFSSILLAVVLIGAIAVLFIRNSIKRRKKNKIDARENFKIQNKSVTHRANMTKLSKNTLDESTSNIDKNDGSVNEEEVNEDDKPAEESVDAPENQNLDDYLYGEVQKFGESDDDTSDEDKEDK